MRVTVTLDDDLVAEAQATSGLTNMSALISYALDKLAQREASRRLALLGGTMPDLEVPDRPRH